MLRPGNNGTEDVHVGLERGELELVRLALVGLASVSLERRLYRNECEVGSRW